MNAIEFVKKFGLDIAQRCLMDCRVNSMNNVTVGESLIPCDDLKQIVEAFELIGKDFESIEIAEYEYMISGCYSDPYWIGIKEAIDLVEQCQ